MISAGTDDCVRTRNAGAEALFGYTRAEAVGRHIDDLIVPKEARERRRAAFAMVMSGQTAVIDETERRHKDGRLIPCDVSASPIVEGGVVTGIVVVLRNITERKAAEQKLRDSEERYRSLVSILTDIPWTTDADGAFVTHQHAWESYTGQGWEQHRGFDWIDAIHPDDRAEMQRLWQVATQSRSQYASRGRVWCAPLREHRYFEARATPLVDEDGGVREWGGTVTDVHEREVAEQRMALLTRETEHRSKNLLALVHAVVRMTRAETVDEYADAVAGRVEALTRVHSLLADRRWLNAELNSLVSEELAPYHADGDRRVLIEGPSLVLAPEGAQSIAMVVHELATNAVKHGALSRPGGRVTVQWEIECGELIFRWSESGGPPAGQPEHKGLGSRLISRSVADQLGGKVRFDWRSEGLRCIITVPASHLTTGANPPIGTEDAERLDQTRGDD